ncbi:hypothetical protein [Elizabethkingia anophelis]|uniref:hypothetical protein n=1 Tax=Elizabethkingia anophelis TaxID=1117645 RepID=UPI002935A726|nr:hypothetical protein [Elizabethkingia anophelis]
MRKTKHNIKIPKRKYTAPVLEVIFVEMENGIAAGSASLNPGDLGSPSTPQAEDWQDNTPVNKDYDI